MITRIKRKRFLKEFRYIFSKEITDLAWYRADDDNIEFLLDKMLQNVWQIFTEKTFRAFNAFLTNYLDSILLHELIHSITESADYKDVDLGFRQNPNETVKAFIMRVEYAVDEAVHCLVGERFDSGLIPVIDLEV